MFLKMKILTLLVVFCAGLRLSATDMVLSFNCADLRPQSYVTIEQLLGIWYGVEIIDHKHSQERLGVQEVDSCPVIHISEDHSPTVPPYYKGNAPGPYGKTYGTHYGTTQYQPKNNQDAYGQVTNRPTTNYYNQQGTYYDQSTGHRGSTDYQGQQYGSEEYYIRRYADEIKRLLLLWTDNEDRVEYTLRYNSTKPGLWMSLDPFNGPTLTPQFDQFSGTIQVIKAVGNHLVLTFCHELPARQLYTAILSRKPKLTRNEIGDVHDLLRGRTLDTYNIKRVCSSQNYNNYNSAFAFTTNKLLLVAFLFLRWVFRGAILI